jgi:hypothetical protein
MGNSIGRRLRQITLYDQDRRGNHEDPAKQQPSQNWHGKSPEYSYKLRIDAETEAPNPHLVELAVSQETAPFGRGSKTQYAHTGRDLRERSAAMY